MDTLRGKGEASSSQETVTQPQSERKTTPQGQAGTSYTTLIGSPTATTTPIESSPSSPWLVNTLPPAAAASLGESGSDSETQAGTAMTSGSSKHRDSSGKKQSSPKSKTQTADDWTDVTEPMVRRRIQNRNAQRKFRELLLTNLFSHRPPITPQNVWDMWLTLRDMIRRENQRAERKIRA